MEFKKLRIYTSIFFILQLKCDYGILTYKSAVINQMLDIYIYVYMYEMCSCSTTKML